MLHLTENGSVYYSKVDYDGLYKWNENGLDVLYQDAKNISAITSSDSGDTLYYSCPEGVFSINTISGERTSVCDSVSYTENADLGNI